MIYIHTKEGKDRIATTISKKLKSLAIANNIPFSYALAVGLRHILKNPDSGEEKDLIRKQEQKIARLSTLIGKLVDDIHKLKAKEGKK